jgi:hypothetical protein
MRQYRTEEHKRQEYVEAKKHVSHYDSVGLATKLFTGQRELFPQKYSDRSMKQTHRIPWPQHAN